MYINILNISVVRSGSGKKKVPEPDPAGLKSPDPHQWVCQWLWYEKEYVITLS